MKVSQMKILGYASCTNCGVKPTSADVEAAIERWLKDNRKRCAVCGDMMQLIGGEITHESSRCGGPKWVFCYGEWDQTDPFAEMIINGGGFGNRLTVHKRCFERVAPHAKWPKESETLT